MTGTDAKWVTQFLGEELTAEENRLETAVCEIIPCGLEKTVSYGSGTAAGPAAIISASHQLERLIGEDEACRHGLYTCLLYTSPSPRDKRQSRMPSSA